MEACGDNRHDSKPAPAYVYSMWSCRYRGQAGYTRLLREVRGHLTGCFFSSEHQVAPSYCSNDLFDEKWFAVWQAVRTAEIAMQGVLRSSAPGSIFSGDRLWGRAARPPAQASFAEQRDADEDGRHLHRRLLGRAPGRSHFKILISTLAV